MTRVDLILFDAGEGHRCAANALRLTIEEQGYSWDVRSLNLQETLDPVDLLHRLTGLPAQEFYNLMLRKGWTLGAGHLIPLLHAAMRLRHRAQLRLLEDCWRERQPDLVVSLVPHFNRVLKESVERTLPGTPFVTILTDFADFPPHFWIEPQEQYLICGSQHAVEQALSSGLRREWIYLTSGMILHPRFYEPVLVDRAAERQRLGLDPHLPTCLIMFGGQGAGVMRKIVHRLDTAGINMQCIVICGRNQKLASALRSRVTRMPMFVEGHTSEMPYYMYLSDFMIGKPGPGSVSEAMAMKLPVIVECSSRTLPQERFNAEWIAANDVGQVVSSFRRIETVVEQFLEPTRLARYRDKIAMVKNRAVLEIPGILKEILQKAEGDGRRLGNTRRLTGSGFGQDPVVMNVADGGDSERTLTASRKSVFRQ